MKIVSRKFHNRKSYDFGNLLQGWNLYKFLIMTGDIMPLPQEKIDELYQAATTGDVAIPATDIQCLLSLEKEWSMTRPFAGKTILFNQHLTKITLIEIWVLLRAGADVHVTATEDLKIHANTLDPIRASGLPYYEKGAIPEGIKFDAIVDCGGTLYARNLAPSIELTHVPQSVYSVGTYPCISVDGNAQGEGTKTKKIETMCGTGDAFVRRLYQELQAQLLLVFRPATAMLKLPAFIGAAMSPSAMISDNRYIIFGYGKVGEGIVAALMSAGASAQNISIVDVDESRQFNVPPETHFFHLEPNKRDPLYEGKRARIKTQAESTFCVVMATGIENALSDHFDQEELAKVKIIANMGTPDEIGSRFKEGEQLPFGRGTANFIGLDFPTTPIYLDAIFTLLLKGVYEAIFNLTQYKPGFNVVDQKIDRQVLGEWTRINGGKKWSHPDVYRKLCAIINGDEEIRALLRPPVSPPLAVDKKSPRRHLDPPTELFRSISCPPPEDVGANISPTAPVFPHFA